MLIRKAEGLNHHILEINILFQWIFQIIKVRRLTSAHVYVHIIAMETFQGDHFHEKKPAESQCIIFIRLRGLTGDTGCAQSLRTLNGDAHHTISLVTDQKHEVVIHTAVIPDKCPNTIHPN